LLTISASRRLSVEAVRSNWRLIDPVPWPNSGASAKEAADLRQ
jgi:hypothetical protein